MNDRPGPIAGRAKLTDVAKAANVSLATASRVLNQPDIVRPDVRMRVLEAVRTLAYTPDRTAKALSSGKSFTVGAVVPTLGTAIFADGVEALQDRLSELGYTLLLSNSQYDPMKELGQIRALLEHGVDGLVLVGDTFAPEVMPLIKQYGVPCITTYVADSKLGLPSIGIDNRRATFELTQYMLSLGHRDFGIISNTALPNDRSKARLQGMIEALDAAGLSPPADRIVEIARPVIASGRTAFQALMAAHRAITAILCTTDALAVGALAEARRMQIDVPGMLSISGYDDVELASEVDPPLTTINVPAGRIGRLAAEHLVAAIKGAEIPVNTRFAARMIIRDSTGPAPGPSRETLAQRRETGSGDGGDEFEPPMRQPAP